MSDRDMEEVSRMEQNEEMDATIVLALEQRPVVRVPEDFAARVARAAAAQPVSARKTKRQAAMGRVVAIAAMVVLAVVLFVVAPQVGTRYASWPFALEMLVLVQMAGIAYGLMRLER